MAVKKKAKKKSNPSSRRGSSKNVSTIISQSISSSNTELDRNSLTLRKLNFIGNEIDESKFYATQNGVVLPFIKSKEDYFNMKKNYDVRFNSLSVSKFRQMSEDYKIWFLDRLNSAYDMNHFMKIFIELAPNKPTSKKLSKHTYEMDNCKVVDGWGMMEAVNGFDYCVKYGIPFFDGLSKMERFMNLIIVNLSYESFYIIMNKIARYDKDAIIKHFDMSENDWKLICHAYNLDVPKKSVFTTELSLTSLKKLEKEVFSVFENTDYTYFKSKLLYNGKKFNKEHYIAYYKGLYPYRNYKLLYWYDNKSFPCTKDLNTINDNNVIFLCSEINDNFKVIPWNDFCKMDETERIEILNSYVRYKENNNLNLASFCDMQKFLSLNYLADDIWIGLFTLHGIKVPNIFKSKILNNKWNELSISSFRREIIDAVSKDKCKDLGFTVSTFKMRYCNYLYISVSADFSKVEFKNFNDFQDFIDSDRSRYVSGNYNEKDNIKPEIKLANPIVETANEKVVIPTEVEITNSVNNSAGVKLEDTCVYDSKIHKHWLLKVITNYVINNPELETIRLEYIMSHIKVNFDDVESRKNVLNEINNFKINGKFQKNGFTLNKIKSTRKHEWIIERYQILIDTLKNLSDFKLNEENTIPTKYDSIPIENKTIIEKVDETSSTVEPSIIPKSDSIAIEATKKTNKFNLEFDSTTIRFKYTHDDKGPNTEELLKYIRNQLNVNLNYADKVEIEINIKKI